jgi:urease accessory protein
VDSIGPVADRLTPSAAGDGRFDEAVESGIRVGRDGLLRLQFVRRGAVTALIGCRYRLPLQVLAPMTLDDPAALVSILNPTGGLVGGDRLTITVDVGPGAHACLTTPAATKVYRTAGAAAEQDAHLRLAPDAVLEWVPDHTIPFRGSALRQRLRVDMGEGARLILVDAFAAGRIARGEAWQFRRLESAVSVADQQGWLFRDRFVLEGQPMWSRLGFTEGRPYFATVALLGRDGLADLRGDLEAVLTAPAGVAGGVGLLRRGGVVVRVIATSAPALLQAIDAVWGRARRILLDLPPLGLRKL